MQGRYFRRAMPRRRRRRSTPARWVWGALGAAGLTVGILRTVVTAPGLPAGWPYALRYGISLELAAAIERAARAEGLDPELAFRLVAVESGFRVDAVSSAGALGLTQILPSTAAELDPTATPDRLLRDPELNLRLGFRYLRRLLVAYDGDLRLALHAYNRGPGTVARLRAAGREVANGYADRILGERFGAPYAGTGLLADSAVAAR